MTTLQNCLFAALFFCLPAFCQPGPVKNLPAVFDTVHPAANLYIPEGKGKFPAVLVMMGHSPNGRFYRNYHAVVLSLVLHSYVTLCIEQTTKKVTVSGGF
jgi:hypothetical protein